MEEHSIMRDEAIFKTHSNVVGITNGEIAYDKNQNIVDLDLNKVKAKQDELEKEWLSQSYYRNRASQYPPITDQLDDLFHQGVFSAEMTAKIQKVKDEFPKPE